MTRSSRTCVLLQAGMQLNHVHVHSHRHLLFQRAKGEKTTGFCRFSQEACEKSRKMDKRAILTMDTTREPIQDIQLLTPPRFSRTLPSSDCSQVLVDTTRTHHSLSSRPTPVFSGNRCFGGFIGVNYAASKLPWTSSLQVSCTLALISVGLWFWFDRTFHGFMISFTVASFGTMVAYMLVLHGWYR